MGHFRRLRTEWLWLAGLLLLVSLHFWFPPVPAGPMHDTHSALAEGKKAFYLLLRQWGDERYFDVARNTRPLRLVAREWTSDGDTAQVLCLLGPARYPTEKEWGALLEWVGQGGTLLVAARLDQPELAIPGTDLEVRSLWDEAGLEPGRLEQVAAPLLSDLDRPNLYWDSEGAIVDGATGDVQTLVEADGTVQAVATPYQLGTIILLASDFVFSNQSLAWAEHDNSLLALRLATWAGVGGRVVFDESLNETGTPKVLGLLLQYPFRPLSVQLLLLLLLFAWYGSRRFGPLLPRSVPSRHDIVDHTNAVGILYYKTGDGTPALRAYLRQLFAEIGLKHWKGKEERVIEPIAVRLQQSPESVRKLLRSASKAARTPRLNRRSAADFIRQLATVRRAAMQPGRESKVKADG